MTPYKSVWGKRGGVGVGGGGGGGIAQREIGTAGVISL